MMKKERVKKTYKEIWKARLQPKRLVIIAVILVLLYLFCRYQNRHLVVSHFSYAHSAVGTELNGFHIVQISDLHNALLGQKNKDLLEKVRDCEPDIIVVTGDVVDANHTNIGTAVDTCRELVSIAPVYYVTGNHEYWLEEDERQELLQGLQEVGVIDLDNRQEEIRRGDDSFWLVGLDDEHLIDPTLAGMTKQHDGLHVVLAHEPQYIQYYERSQADLVLSGHAHGGQIRLPWIGGLVAPNQGFLPTYTAGEYKENDMTMIVSRGLGNSVIPVRLFNFPEVVCVEFVSQ